MNSSRSATGASRAVTLVRVGTAMAGLKRNARKAQQLATAGRFLQALAVAESVADDFQQAVADSVRQLHGEEKAAEVGDLRVALAGALTGDVLLELGDYGRAIPALEAAARATRGYEVRPGDARGALRTYRLLARAHGALGDHEAEREALDAGLGTLERGRAWAEGELAKVVGSRMARRVLHRDHEPLEAMLELASSLIELAEADAAERLLHEVAAGIGLVPQKWRGPLWLLVGTARARVAALRGDLVAADRLYAALRDAVPAGSRSDVQAELTTRHASVKADLGDLDTAQRLYEAAVGGYASLYGPNHPAVARTLSALADVHCRRGNGERARDMLLDVTDGDETLVQVVGVVCEQQRLRYLSQVKRDLDRLLELLVTTPPDPRVRRRVFDVVLRRKALGFEVDRAQRETGTGVGAGGDPTWDRLVALRTRIGQKVLAGPGAEGPEEHDRIVGRWERDRDELEADLVRSRPLVSVSRLARLDSAVLSALVPEGAVVVEVVDTGREYIAFVCGDHADAISVVRLGATKAIDPLIAQLLDALGDAPVDGDRVVDELGRTLAATLLGPLRSAVGSASRWMVAPDGLLAALPLEILPTQQGSLLCDDVDLTYLTAARDLISLAERVALPRPSAPMVGGAPDYELGRTAGGGTPRFPYEFAALRHTEAEARTVAELLGVEPLLAGEVLKDVVLRGVAPQVLHLATHGYSIPLPEPRRSRVLGPESNRGVGLALAGANTWASGGTPPPDAGNGLLSAEDVLAMDLSGTELVTLSACATGTGRAVAGEGLFGLRRSFLVAGARSLVVTAWNVPDRVTATFMAHFYSALIGGASKLHALQHARARVRQQRPNVRFWGAFTLLGDTSPLREIPTEQGGGAAPAG